MTWSKFGTEFRDECAEVNLSDAAFRTHVEAIMYLYGIENMDLVLQRHLVRRWAGSDDYRVAVDELVRVKWWIPVEGGWKVVHHEDVVRQSIVRQQQIRENDKKRKRKSRAREDGPEGSSVTQDVTEDVTRDVRGTQSVRQTDIQIAPSAEQNEYIDEQTGEVIPLGAKEPDPVDPWADGGTSSLRRCDVCNSPVKAGQVRHPNCRAELDRSAS